MYRTYVPYVQVCEAGDKDLQEILDEQGSKPLPENQCRYIFECMVAAVRHLHSLDLVSSATAGGQDRVPYLCLIIAQRGSKELF